MHRLASLSAVGLLIASLAGTPASAEVDERPPMHLTPGTTEAPAVRSAAVFELKLRVEHGQDFAGLLLSAGVDAKDADRAADLARMPCHQAIQCIATVALSQVVGKPDFRLERVTLSTISGQRIIDRRDDRLVLIDEDRRAIRHSRIA